jgi:hypothetical protein
MLEYAKTILRKVSFDPRLFEKELIKALNILVPKELKELKKWCYENFGHMYNMILNKHLSHI